MSNTNIRNDIQVAFKLALSYIRIYISNSHSTVSLSLKFTHSIQYLVHLTKYNYHNSTKIILAVSVGVVFNREAPNGQGVESNVCSGLNTYNILTLSLQSPPQWQSAVHFKAALTHRHAFLHPFWQPQRNNSSHCEIFYMSLARGTSGKKESLVVPLNIDWSPTFVHIFPIYQSCIGVIYHMTWKLRMVPQNSSLARRTSVEACFTGPTVISLATAHRTSGFRDDCNSWVAWLASRIVVHTGYHCPKLDQPSLREREALVQVGGQCPSNMNPEIHFVWSGAQVHPLLVACLPFLTLSSRTVPFVWHPHCLAS